MRHIKFRGFQEKWIYGGISVFNGETTIYDENCIANSAYEVENDSVGQFTELKDKNGKEIYEGDVLELINNFGEKWFFLIKYSSEFAGFMGFDLKMKSFMYHENNSDFYSFCNAKIIGNIYENSEFLA